MATNHLAAARWSSLRIMATNHLATAKWSLLGILATNCLVATKPFSPKILDGKLLMANKWLSSGILLVNRLVNIWRLLPIFWLGNKFWKKWIWRSKSFWFPCAEIKRLPKKSYLKSFFHITNISFVYYWLGKIWLRDSCLATLLTFRIFVKMNRWDWYWNMQRSITCSDIWSTWSGELFDGFTWNCTWGLWGIKVILPNSNN